MKKKLLIGLLGASLAASLLCGCGSSTETTAEVTVEVSAEEEEAETVTYTGTITALSESSITIETENGETVEIAVTDETVYTSMSFGGMQGGMQQQNGDLELPDGATGELPETTDGEVPEMGDGELPEATDGEMSQMGNGEMQENLQEKGEMPTSDAEFSADGEMPEMGDGDTNGRQMPSADGDLSAEAEVPEMGDGDMSSFAGTTISFSDLAVGDSVTITLDESGNAATVVVAGAMSMDMEAMGDMGDGSQVEAEDAEEL